MGKCGVPGTCRTVSSIDSLENDPSCNKLDHFPVNMNDMTMMMYEYDVIGINQCLCLPKAELNTKNSTRWQLCCHLVEFLVLNSTTHVG